MTIRAVSIFTRNLVTNFRTLGEIAPYSNFTGRKIIKFGKVKDAQTILEIGPGLGKFTREILKNSGNTSQITIVEKLEEFAVFLDKNLIDTRLKIIHGDILAEKTLSQLPANSFDSVISSIPLSFLTIEQRKEFAKMIHRILKPKGVFINAQYSLSSKKYFEDEGMLCEWNLEALNIPPTFIFTCTKKI